MEVFLFKSYLKPYWRKNDTIYNNWNDIYSDGDKIPIKKNITFQSANPFSFEEIIVDFWEKPKMSRKFFGTLTLPNDYDPDTKYPLIIGGPRQV
ncbi:MAG: hypothetical protein Ct9H300mP24_4630 [Candidatus Neomarinimicrobiota bacterium]|nr:MAG: hypothetical protein Ct9H300mP24_4630 [Candidatus Neomarinimicrobiota bacterium]